MSYYLEAAKDTPIGLYMLDGNVLDGSGKGNNGTAYGSGSYDSTPLVNGASKSLGLTAASYVGVPFEYLKPGTERQAFSLEAWFFPIDSSSFVLAHATDFVGLSYYLDTVSFVINFAGAPTASVGYYLNRKKLVHAVATYTGNAMILYVNGVAVGSYELTDEQRAAAFTLAVNNNMLYSGSANLNSQALATYNYALTEVQVKSHYDVGMQSAGSNASGLFGGKLINISDKTAEIFFERQWTDFTVGYGNALRDDTSVSSAVDPVTGAYIDSSWEDSFELDSGGDNIDGVQIDWDGQFVHTVETSLDGENWMTATNTKRIADIPAGYNPTDMILRVRVKFSAGNFGKVTRLKLLGIKSLNIRSTETNPVTVPIGATFAPLNEINTLDTYTGVGSDTAGTIGIGPNTDEGFEGYKSIGFWYYISTGGSMGNSSFAGTGNQIYENGLPVANWILKYNRWVHIVLSRDAFVTSQIAFSLTNARLTNIVLYEDKITDAQVNRIYTSYLGNNRIPIDSETAAAVVDSPATLYAADWSIQPAG